MWPNILLFKQEKDYCYFYIRWKYTSSAEEKDEDKYISTKTDTKQESNYKF